jgi:hypothetical protein
MAKNDGRTKGIIDEPKFDYTRTKPMGDVVAEIDWDKALKDPWTCEVCGITNTNWMPTVALLFGENGPQWMHGTCAMCSRREEERLTKEATERAREERRLRVLTLWERAALPKELAKIKFGDLIVRDGAQEAFEALNEFDISVEAPWICLMGDNNTGKSRLMAATSNRQNGRLVPTLYINESLFFKTVRESWDGDGNAESEAKIMSIFELPEIVMWDEFLFYDYMERGWIYERAYAILERLAEMNKMVVFGTNVMNVLKRGDVDSQSIEGRSGRRIWARIQRRRTRFITMKNEPFF